MKKISTSTFECIGCSYFSFSFLHSERFIYQEAPQRRRDVPESRREREGQEQERQSQYQAFELGEHDVLPAERISRDYVSQISGSVDLVPYSEERKSDQFYQSEVNEPCRLLVNIYDRNENVFTGRAKVFIEENIVALYAIRDVSPRNHNEFSRLLERFSPNQIYGPDGVLNLLLAFNRVRSKLVPQTLERMADPHAEQMLRIDLQKRGQRSVEVSLLSPEIREPNIQAVRLDIPGLETIKRMKPDGTYEVQYWENHRAFGTSPATRDLAWQLNINPHTRMVTVTRYWRSPGPIQAIFTFDQFDSEIRRNAYFLHGGGGSH